MVSYFCYLWKIIVIKRNSPYRITGEATPYAPCYNYREGERKVTVSVESTSGDVRGNVVVYGFSLAHWDAPHEAEPIADGKKEQILQRLHDHEEKRGVHFWLDDTPLPKKWIMPIRK